MFSVIERERLFQIQKLHGKNCIFSQMKRQSTKCEKLFSNLISAKVLIPKICKECIELNSKNNPIKKMGKGLNRLFFFCPKEDIPTGGQQTREKMLNITDPEGANRSHSEPARTATISESTSSRCRREHSLGSPVSPSPHDWGHLHWGQEAWAPILTPPHTSCAALGS